MSRSGSLAMPVWEPRFKMAHILLITWFSVLARGLAPSGCCAVLMCSNSAMCSSCVAGGICPRLWSVIL